MMGYVAHTGKGKCLQNFSPKLHGKTSHGKLELSMDEHGSQAGLHKFPTI